jgi:hypothetical protein
MAPVQTMTTVSSVIPISMVTGVGMSAAVAMVTSSATMETSCRATVKSSSATMTTVLGKSSVWQPAKRANANDCEKNS